MNQIALYRQVHEEDPKYGSGPGPLFCKQVADFLAGVPVKRALDFGCGRSRALSKIFPADSVQKIRYDPAIPEIAVPPRNPVDVTICTDVMEHIPFREVADVLTFIDRMTKKRAYFLIHTGKASKILPNGENAHCTICPPVWWKHTLSLAFGNVRKFEVKGRCKLVYAFECWPSKTG